MNRILASRLLPLMATGLVLVALFAAAGAGYENFLSARVVLNLFKDRAFLGVVAVGMTFVILSGGIDLSVGAVMAFTTVFLAKVIGGLGWSAPVAMLAAVGIGVGFGLFQGWVIHYFRIPAFLVTLAGMFLARGMAFVVSPRSVEIRSAFYDDLGERGLPLGEGLLLTVGPLIYLVVVAAGMVVAHGTRFGRTVYALGGNEASAALMGLPVGATRVAVYGVCGGCAALGGVISTLALSSGDPTRGTGLELDAIAAAVIGGTVLTGGRGWVFGTFLGVLILGTIKTILDFDGSLDPAWLRIASGGLLLGFILLQKLIARQSVS
jgi:ribose/xylose/arabinose/galactoside ABC-type transport system permease subunit